MPIIFNTVGYILLAVSLMLFAVSPLPVPAHIIIGIQIFGGIGSGAVLLGYLGRIAEALEKISKR
jgi:hypothetical protein